MVARNSKVGVRELRQNLSVYLRRVRLGETLEVTERGRSVALLTPLPRGATPAARLIAMGIARPAAGDILDLGPPPGPPTTKVSEALEADRDDRL